MEVLTDEQRMADARTKVIGDAILAFSVTFMVSVGPDDFADPRNQERINQDMRSYVNQKLTKAGFSPIPPRQNAPTSSPAPQSPEV